ncbi:hypothetical protein C0J52_20127 [Blattella germanica]|nr:hypothetical protein C0J52_20127 [Blattella germanica]
MLASLTFNVLCVMTLYTFSAWAKPLTSTDPGVNIDFLTNIGDNVEKLNIKKKASESLQVYDHVILEEGGSLLFSNAPGDNAGLPEMTPTVEELVPGQNSAKIDVEDMTPVNRENPGSLLEADIVQVL